MMLEFRVMNEVGAEKALGKAIQNARKAAGLTQQELCQKTGISYSTLAKIERGAIKSPSVFTVAHIAGVCGVSVEDMVGSAVRVQKTSPRAYATAKNGIKFVFFDINGCMVRFFQAAFTQMAADTGASAEVIEGTFWHYNDAVCRGEMPVEEFNRVLAERLGVASIDWAKYYLDGIEIIAEAQECLRWAAESFRVGLLSNIMPGLIDAMFERGTLPKVDYQAIIDSSKVGFIKPEVQIFEYATTIAGVQPNEILLVDDSRANLMAAEKFGWNVLWFDDFRPDESVARVKQSLEI